MSLFSDALNRLLQYNLGPFSLSSNPFGLTGAGGPDTNLEPMLGDIATVGQASADNATAASESAAAAHEDAQAAHEDRIATEAAAAAAQTWDPTNYSRRYTMGAVGADDWVKLGTWTAGTADRLLIELTGAFAYVPDQPGRLGGLTTITATMMADTNTSLANMAGQFAYLGNSVCTAVKFVQNGTNRYSYHVYISRYAYTTMTYRVLCGGTWTAVNAASQASPGAGGTATVADATARGAILTSNEAIQQNIVVLANVGGTFTPNCQSGNEFDCGTLGAAATIASPTNVPSAGKVQPISIKWTQDGTGGRVMSFGANCINVGGTSANTTAGKVNFAVGKVYSDGKFYYSIVRGA